MKPEIILTSIIVSTIVAAPVLADPPKLQTAAPVIFLADNLDEQDHLGWCIDTLGRGFAERLQAHSCKPAGGDVQFTLNANTGQIQSVEYPAFCMAYRPNDQSTFALETCDTSVPEQQFQYHPENRTIRTADDETMCVSVGQNGRSAGPFMSRSLLLTKCAATDEAFKEWLVLE